MRQGKYPNNWGQGAPINTSHDWNYTENRWKERKYAPKKWKGYYYQTKRRRRPSPKGSGAPIGSQFLWKGYFIQKARKVGKDTYKLKMVMDKHLLKAYIPKKKQNYNKQYNYNKKYY